MKYVILAAGNGRRFAEEGVKTPKPLVEVMGKPMIGRLIDILTACGAESINIVSNRRMGELTAYLHKRKAEGAPLEIRPIESENSYRSLAEASRGIDGKFVALTVDTIFSTDEFREFVRRFEEMPEGETLMGLTGYVDDESPLYAKIEGDAITDYRYGGEPFAGDVRVSAGIYGLTAESVATGGEAQSLSDWQRQLAREGRVKVKPHVLGKALDIDNSHDRIEAEIYLRTLEYKSTLKSMDTEEHIDLMFYRPIGYAWALLFRRLGVSPNAVTIASIFIGIAAGICFYFPDIRVNAAGILLLVWANTYDSCDGQLARLTGRYSPLGRILDGIAGDLWFLTIYIAICLRTVHTVGFFEQHNWAIWLIGAAAGASHIMQAAVADRYRQLHLFFLKGAKGSELDTSTEVARRYLSLTWKQHFFAKLIQYLYYRYTVYQEKLTPRMKAFRLKLRERYENEGIPKRLSDEFLGESVKLCKWENFMTFNWRTIFLFTCILTGYPWVYFGIELTVFNAVLVYTIARHEAICREMTRREG